MIRFYSSVVTALSRNNVQKEVGRHSTFARDLELIRPGDTVTLNGALTLTVEKVFWDSLTRSWVALRCKEGDAVIQISATLHDFPADFGGSISGTRTHVSVRTDLLNNTPVEIHEVLCILQAGRTLRYGVRPQVLVEPNQVTAHRGNWDFGLLLNLISIPPDDVLRYLGPYLSLSGEIATRRAGACFRLFVEEGVPPAPEAVQDFIEVARTRSITFTPATVEEHLQRVQEVWRHMWR